MATTDAAALMRGARDALQHMVFDDTGSSVGGFDSTEFSIVEPTVGGTSGVVIIHVGGARWGLPRGVRIAPGRECIFVMTETGRTHTLVARDGRVRELRGPVAYEARVRRERFGRP